VGGGTHHRRATISDNGDSEFTRVTCFFSFFYSESSCFSGWSRTHYTINNKCSAQRIKTKFEVDALGVITISRGCFERCGSNKKTFP